MLSLLRAIKFAFQDIFRNFSLSFMTVLILVLMLLSVNTLIIIRTLTIEATQLVKNQVDVSVFFVNDATSEQIREVREYVGSFPEVTDITYKTEEQVLEEFKSQYVDNKEISESLSELGENPLGPMMVLKTREPKDYQKVITALSVPEYEHIIEAKTFADTEKAIQRIDVITQQVETFSLVVTGLFAFIAFLIIFNTIRVAIYTQRVEISIKKLVGATNWFIRSPYVIEAFIFTLLSVAVTAVLVRVALDLIDPYIRVIFGRSGILTAYFYSNILTLAGIQIAAVLFLTVCSSMLAMRKYLKV